MMEYYSFNEIQGESFANVNFGRKRKPVSEIRFEVNVFFFFFFGNLHLYQILINLR